MRRVVACCLLVLLTACAGGSAPPPATPRATVGPAATATVTATQMAAVAVVTVATRGGTPAGARPCPEGRPVKGVGREDGTLRAVVPGDADYERVAWLRCFATLEEAGAAGFVRSATGGVVAATPGTPTVAIAAAAEAAVVVRVIDAFTIEVRLGDGRVETVRYLGVDAPDECDGGVGSAYNATLVGGRTVRLESDLSERDRFERLLRYVWVVGDDGVSRLANEEVVRAGHAATAIQPPDVRYEERLRAAEREAYGSSRGLWGACADLLVPPVMPTATPAPPTPTSLIPTPTPRPPTATPAPPAPPTVVPPTPRPPAPPTATTAPAVPTATRVPPAATRVPPTATRASACHPSYPTLCLPGAPDLDCKDVPQRNFPVLPPDPHGLDGDKDGIGCET